MVDSGQGGMGKPGYLQGTTDSEQGGMGRCGHVQGMTDSEQGLLDIYKGPRNGKGWTCTRDDRQ